MILEEQIRIISKIKNELGKRSARLFSLMISGSNLYGFSSEDSDVDLRGIFVYTTNKLVGLSKPKETLELEIDDYDIVLHELGKAIKQLYKGNSNFLENFFSPQIYTSPNYVVLEPLIVLNKHGIYNSYKGLAISNYKKFIRTGRKKTVKKYLYIFRALMAGIYALEVRKIQPNINQLNKHFKNPYVKVLVKMKKAGKEKDDLPVEMDTGVIEANIEKLLQKIKRAYQRTKLGEPSRDDFKELNDYLIIIRKKMMDT